MTKKELIAALETVEDNATIMFGMKEEHFFGAFATQVYTDWDGEKVLITNEHTDVIVPVYCELLHKDKTSY